MRVVDFGGEQRTIAANPMSVVEYERAFGDAHSLHEDINAFLESRKGPLVVLPVGALLRLQYAFERSATSGLFPDFDSWARKVPASALDQGRIDDPDGWVMGVLDEVVACFFPQIAQPQGTTTAE